MTFTVGETVVYPNHGAAVIEDIETRQILVSELALAEHTNEDKAEALLDEVLAS
jgi:RNA polymerase-interacting CarD/CdnL/TRCF family regulator